MENEVISALPTGGPADASVLRNFLIKRAIYTFIPSEDPTTFEALDGDTGALPQALGFNGSVFWLDPNDSTSAGDNVAVIKTADDYRYKVAGNYDFRSVINFTTTTPPASPSLGDKYIVPAGATGAWSSHQDDLTVWTPNGWQFVVPSIGAWVLDEAVGGFISYTSSGWVYGPGARSFSPAIIPFSAALGWGAKFEVENQTTTTPPTATVGLRYIVGASATDSWAGKDKQIAICEVADTWTFYPPQVGWQAFDKAQSAAFTWSGTVWQSTAGTWIDRAIVKTTSGSTTGPTGTTGYVYSTSTAPTTSNRRTVDNATLTYTAKRAGSALRFHYRADVSYAVSYNGGGAQPDGLAVAILMDSNTNAVVWHRASNTPDSLSQLALLASSGSIALPSAFTMRGIINEIFYVDAPDTNSHQYSFIITSCVSAGAVNIDASSFTLRTFEIEESA